MNLLRFISFTKPFQDKIVFSFDDSKLMQYILVRNSKLLVKLLELKKCCVACLGESLNKTNCLDIKLSGQMFNCPALSDTAETLAAQNFEEVVHQVQFKELDKNEAVKFLSSRDQKVHIDGLCEAIATLLVIFAICIFCW